MDPLYDQSPASVPGALGANRSAGTDIYRAASAPGAAQALLDECVASLPERIERAAMLRDGTFNGRRVIQDPKGRLLLVAEYRGGRLNGRFELRREQCFRHIVAECRDGYFHGDFTEYWDNGRPKESGCYEQDQPVGRYTWYDRDGEVTRTHDFVAER